MSTDELLHLEIHDRRAFADGAAFGDVGAYERITATAHLAVDPQAPAQAGIVDLEHAPVNADGRVELASEVMLLTPAEADAGNRRLFFDFGNRGNKRALQYFNDAPASNDPLTGADAGNGFLMRRGYSVVWAGWQGDLLPGSGRSLLHLPVATRDGEAITGRVRGEFIVTERGVTTQPLSGAISTRSHPTVSMDPRDATFTRRRYADAPREEIGPERWAFARVERGEGIEVAGTEASVIPSATHVHLPEGFEPGWIYELVYTGRDPLVMGLGHVAVRDLVTFLRRSASADNPLAGRIERAYAWGRSQTGRAIRDFVWRGYNAAVDGGRVFDAVMPHVSGAGLLWMNHRFANGVTSAGQQYEVHDTPADHFPFSYAETTDHLTGRRDAILKRPETDPLVIHTQTATEYWQRRGSLVHTDTRGADLPQPDGVRVYLWSSSQHQADPLLTTPTRGVCQNLVNQVATSMLFRAALDALDAWASDGTPPPPSRVPLVADGTLVDVTGWREGFPPVPGVMLPREPNRLELFDFGARADEGVLDEFPPRVVDAEGYPVLVPVTDADGNDVAGVRAPTVAAPLGTYTGWNLRDRGQGHGALHLYTGSYLPFPDTPEEREVTGDPRTSVLERYTDAEAYVAAVEAACRALVAERFVLAEDVPRAVAAARDWGRPRHVTTLVGVPHPGAGTG